MEEPKTRYSIDLSPMVPKLSINMGIREKHFDKSSEKYSHLNDLLRDIYEKCSQDLSLYGIYEYLQNISASQYLIQDGDNFAERIEELSVDYPLWQPFHANHIIGYWVQTHFCRKDDNEGVISAQPNDIKVYASFAHNDIKDIYIDSLNYLLKNVKYNFTAKIATRNRCDQMCYWLKLDDFRHLEDFYRQYTDDMVESMPFVAYKGKLGISKEFSWFEESHNATQALIISEYLKCIQSVDFIDVGEMYNLYIKKWNGDVCDGTEKRDAFESHSALSFVIILDTLDSILGTGHLLDDSSLFSNNEKMWEILSVSRCWEDVNEKWEEYTKSETIA